VQFFLFSLFFSFFPFLFVHDSPFIITHVLKVVFFVKTIVDTVGASVLKELLLFSNLHSLPPIIRIVLNLALVSLIFGSVIVILTSKLMTDEQIKIVTETFLAVWFLSRITEVFHLGTLWAFKVSYGSSVGCNII
jgi:hypothetical protein